MPPGAPSIALDVNTDRFASRLSPGARRAHFRIRKSEDPNRSSPDSGEERRRGGAKVGGWRARRPTVRAGSARNSNALFISVAERIERKFGWQMRRMRIRAHTLTVIGGNYVKIHRNRSRTPTALQSRSVALNTWTRRRTTKQQQQMKACIRGCVTLLELD